MSEIDELIEKVQAAEGRLDDETLGRVICALKGLPFECVRKMGDEIWIRTNGNRYPMPIYFRSRAPDVCIDSTLELLGEAFPGWLWTMGSCWVSDDARIFPDFNSPIHGPALHAHFGEYEKGSPLDEGFDVDRRPPTGKPCLALLEAMLMAKEYVLEFDAARAGKVGAA